VTNLGALKVEIHCDKVPKTGENFLELCESKYFDKTSFHRLIPGFMIQGGDPEGSGKGGKSIFEDENVGTSTSKTSLTLIKGDKSSFADEFHPSLTHDTKGILSMANSGPNTNKSQFFITFDECPHLDNKHAIFGKVHLESLPVVDKMENVGFGNDKTGNRPAQEITIIQTNVLVNPIRDMIAQVLVKEWE